MTLEPVTPLESYESPREPFYLKHSKLAPSVGHIYPIQWVLKLSIRTFLLQTPSTGPRP